MSKLTLTATLFLVALFTHRLAAQQHSGRIVYKHTLQLELDEAQLSQIPEAMRQLLPTQHSSQHELLFNTQASLFKNIQQAEAPTEYESEEGQVEVVVQRSFNNNQYYNDLTTNYSLESKDLMGRRFLIEHHQKRVWKIHRQSKELLGYDCQKASSTNKDGTVTTAWFAKAIPVAVGPENIHGLPGVILAASSDDGRIQWTATAIELHPVASQQLAVPKKGKRVSAQEFKAIAEAKQQELKEQYGGSGNVIIQTHSR
jgi:GLPGLI family protein